MKKQTDTFKRLRAVMKDVNGDHSQIIKTMQDQIDYLMEFLDIQGCFPGLRCYIKEGTSEWLF